MVDPTGMINRKEVVDGELEYSCNCGWIDWNHVGTGVPAFELLANIKALRDSVDQSSGFTHYGITYRIPLLVDQITFWESTVLVELTDVIDKSNEDLLAFALHVYMDANEEIEAQQNLIPHPFPGSASGWSEEDLPSNLLGFYYGSQRFFRDLNPTPGEESIDIRQEIATLCGTLDPLEPINGQYSTNISVSIFDNTYAGGSNIERPWKNWYPRLIPLLGCGGNIDFTYSPIGNCNRQQRSFPLQFQEILQLRNRPSPIPYSWMFDIDNSAYWYRGQKLVDGTVSDLHEYFYHDFSNYPY